MSNTLQSVSVGPQDAATLLGIGRTKIFELIKDGELPTAKIGQRTLIPVSALHALIERRTQSRNEAANDGERGAA